MNLYLKNISKKQDFLVKENIDDKDTFFIHDVSALFQGVVIKITHEKEIYKIKVFANYSIGDELEFFKKD